MARALLLIFFTILQISVAWSEDKCPDPIIQVTDDIRGKIDGTVNTFLRLGKINVTGDVDVLTKDVLHQYPNANRVALEQNTLSILCNKVLTSKDYGQAFKEKMIEKMLDKIGQ
jgi:hypothetical protein